MELTTAFPVLIVLLIVLLFGGLEIAFTLGIVGVIGIVLLGGGKIPLEALAQSAWSTASSYVLIAIALFVLMSALVQQSGIAQAFYTSAATWLGRLPGGVALGGVAACTLNSGASISSQANVITIGPGAIADMERQGHGRRLTLGALAAGGTLSLLVLPSIAMIVYAFLAQTSIGLLFMAGLVPGLILSVLFLAYVLIIGLFRLQVAPKTAVPSGRQLGIGVVNMLPPVILGILIFVVIFIGIMTPTEAAALAAFVAFILALIWTLVWRRPILSVLRKAVRQTVQTTCMIIFVLIVGVIFAQAMAFSGATQGYVEFMTELQMSPALILGLVCVGYIILGCFIEPLTLMVVTLPFIVPVVYVLGFDPVWFGVILMILIGIGMILPPVGRNLRAVQSLSRGHPTKEIFIGAAPFLVLMVVVLGLVVAFPAIALWLPGLMR